MGKPRKDTDVRFVKGPAAGPVSVGEPRAAWARVVHYSPAPNHMGYAEAVEASPVIVFANEQERNAGLAALAGKPKQTHGGGLPLPHDGAPPTERTRDDDET